MIPLTRILLVEDDADDRFLFEQAVSERCIGSSVLTAGNGIEALELLEKCSELPDVIFMDVNMPVMNGLECLKEIKSRKAFSTVEVIMISTAINDEIRHEAKTLGARAFSGKPFSFDELADMIAVHLNSLQVVRG